MSIIGKHSLHDYGFEPGYPEWETGNQITRPTTSFDTLVNKVTNVLGLTCRPLETCPVLSTFLTLTTASNCWSLNKRHNWTFQRFQNVGLDKSDTKSVPSFTCSLAPNWRAKWSEDKNYSSCIPVHSFVFFPSTSSSFQFLTPQMANSFSTLKENLKKVGWKRRFKFFLKRLHPTCWLWFLSLPAFHSSVQL